MSLPLRPAVGVVTGTIQIGTILTPIQVGTIQVPEVVSISTIANSPLITVQGNVNVATISNAPLVTVSTIPYVGTIANAPLITVGTILNSPQVTAQVTVSTIPYVGTIANAPQVTVGTILNPVVVATILTPSQVINNQNFRQTNILTNVVVTTSGAATLTAGAFQDLVVDVVYGTVISGSIQTVIKGVEPQSGIQTSTIVAGAWFAGTIVTGQRLVAAGPLGALVAVVWNVPAASTITGVFITAEQSTSV